MTVDFTSISSIVIWILFISTTTVLAVLPDNLDCSRKEDNNIGGMSNPESFFSKLESRIAEIDSHLCVGLDPHIKELFPNGDGDSKSEQERCDAAYDFCKRIIDATGEFNNFKAQNVLLTQKSTFSHLLNYFLTYP